MQKKSWLILSACLGLGIFLMVAYVGSQGAPEALTQSQAMQGLEEMRSAMEHKSVNGIMDHVYFGPDTHLAGLNADQLRVMLARYFREAGNIRANYSKVDFKGGSEEASVEFDLKVLNENSNMSSTNYDGHVTLHLKRVDVPRLWGMFQGKEWRIVGADASNLNLSDFGDI